MFEEIYDDLENSLKETNKIQYVAMILDKSGSMSGMKNTIENIMHEQLTELDKLSKENNIRTYVIISLFSGNKEPFIMETFDISNKSSIRKCYSFVSEKYKPEGKTALYDSMFKTIRSIEDKNDNAVKGSNIENLIITVSDGYENDSIEIGLDTIKRKVKRLEEKDDPKWKFVYLGTMESLESAKNMEIDKINTMDFTGVEDLKMKFNTISSSNQKYYRARSRGINTKNIAYNDRGEKSHVDYINSINSTGKE